MTKEVKTTFEWQGRIFKAYWNGKKYGESEDAYVTATSPTGSQTKVSLKNGRAHAGGGGSGEFASAACKAVGLL